MLPSQVSEEAAGPRLWQLNPTSVTVTTSTNCICTEDNKQQLQQQVSTTDLGILLQILANH